LLRQGLRRLAVYGFTLAACVGILVRLMRLWRADLNVPLHYWGDAVFMNMVIRTMIDHGWFLTNPCVGVPGGCQLYDFPMADNLHLGVMKLLSLGGLGPAGVLNLYFLMTFPLAALSSLLVLRHFRVCAVPAVAVSLLFAFLPYHFHRATGHVFLSGYYLVPLTVMVALWLYRGPCPLVSPRAADEKSRLDLWAPRSLASVLICVLVSCAGVYYAFFGCFFLLIAGLAARVSRREPRALLAAGVLAAVITAGCLVNIAPCLAYGWTHGPNRQTRRTEYVAAEVYGLKMAQLLLPVSGHRLPPLERLKARYDHDQAPPDRASALGTVAGVGFLLLIFRFLFRRPAPPGEQLADGLALFNVSAVLLGTVGGLGCLFAFLVDPSIRCYNRICVYIAFFCLFGVALVLERVWQRYRASPGRRLLCLGAFGLLVGLGILDQAAPYFAADYRETKRDYLQDAEFVGRIERRLPPGSMVFQLPCVAFPEAGFTCRMFDYDHFRGYLHSKSLRWSYGAMKGRPGGDWLAELQAKPVEEVLPAVARAGFRGLWLDRFGYEDAGGKAVTALQRLLGEQPLSSRNGRFLFFDLRDYARRLHLPAKYCP
jgi:phosphoglycerol transferase